MALITLIGEPQAVEGREFYFMGPIADCKDCRLKGVCFNLEAGSRYRVVAVRSQKHECQECEGEVVAVEVEKVPTPAAVTKKGTMDGVTITYSESRCDMVSCPNYHMCHALGKKDGQKYMVTAVRGDVDCPRGESLLDVDLL